MEGGLRVVGMGYGRDTAMYQFSNAVDECLLDSPFLFLYCQTTPRQMEK